jgi:hypothetical protein
MPNLCIGEAATLRQGDSIGGQCGSSDRDINSSQCHGNFEKTRDALVPPNPKL